MHPTTVGQVRGEHPMMVALAPDAHPMMVGLERVADCPIKNNAGR